MHVCLDDWAVFIQPNMEDEDLQKLVHTTSEHLRPYYAHVKSDEPVRTASFIYWSFPPIHLVSWGCQTLTAGTDRDSVLH